MPTKRGFTRFFLGGLAAVGARDVGGEVTRETDTDGAERGAVCSVGGMKTDSCTGALVGIVSLESTK